MTEITHERCSELLGGHLRGDLGPENAAAVENHLAGCQECRAELAGLRALSAEDIGPLGDDERRSLRDAVLREARHAPATVVEFPARRSFWERHAGQIVGAAASIVVVLFAVLVFQGLGGDDAGDGAGGGGDDGAATAQDDSEGADTDAGGPQPVFASEKSFAALADRPEAEEANQGEDAEQGEEPESERSLAGIEARDVFTENSITRLGTSGRVFRDFAEAYTADDIPTLSESFLDQLASEAPNTEVAEQVLDCRDAITAGVPGRLLLPTYATVAEFNGEESLILGFVLPDATTEDLSRFSIYVWPLGDCKAFPYNSFGDIGP